MPRAKGSGRKTGRKDTMNRDIYEYGGKQKERATDKKMSHQTLGNVMNDISYDKDRGAAYSTTFPKDSLAAKRPELITMLNSETTKNIIVGVANMISPKFGKVMSGIKHLHIDMDEGYDGEYQMMIRYKNTSKTGTGQQEEEYLSFKECEDIDPDVIDLARLSRDELLKQKAMAGDNMGGKALQKSARERRLKKEQDNGDRPDFDLSRLSRDELLKQKEMAGDNMGGKALQKSAAEYKRKRKVIDFNSDKKFT